MSGIHAWTGQQVLDVGCGSGFHLPRFAQTASHVLGVEPHEPLALLARQRLSELSLTNASVLDGVAQDLLLADDSVDVAHARWAYFFGPGCEPGLAELERVLRPGAPHWGSTTTPRDRLLAGGSAGRGRPMTLLGLHASGRGRDGHESASTSAGRSTCGQTSSRSCGSSSPRPSPTGSWPSTRARTWTMPSTYGGEPSAEPACRGRGPACNAQEPACRRPLIGLPAWRTRRPSR